MFRMSNVRIGTKLGVMSGLGILMVFGMVAAVMYGNSSIKSANEVALQQQRIARDVMAVQIGRASCRERV